MAGLDMALPFCFTCCHDYRLECCMEQQSLKLSPSGSKTAHTRLTLGAMLHPGSTVSHPHHGAARTKTTLSFQNLEAALPPGIPAGRRSNSRSSVRYMPELATIGSIPAANGRCAWRDREVWMQSEPCCPRIILSYIRAACGEECAADRDSFMRTGRTCM